MGLYEPHTAFCKFRQLRALRIEEQLPKTVGDEARLQPCQTAHEAFHGFLLGDGGELNVDSGCDGGFEVEDDFPLLVFERPGILSGLQLQKKLLRHLVAVVRVAGNQLLDVGCVSPLHGPDGVVVEGEAHAPLAFLAGKVRYWGRFPAP